MKKILSFLQKKPLALAAVALFSMSSYAEETGPKTDNVWTRVTDGTSLKAFDYVTFVDEPNHVIYNGYHEVATYEENPSTQGQGFYVIEGYKPTDFDEPGRFPESSWAFKTDKNESNKGSIFLTEFAELEKNELLPEVSWYKENIANGEVKSLSQGRWFYYDTERGYFQTSTTLKKVSLYKKTDLARPVFDPETGTAIWVDPEAPAAPSINISIPGIDGAEPVGDISYKVGDGKYNDGKGTSTDVTPDYEDGKSVTITAKNVYGGGETAEVSATYTFVTIALPVIAPVKEDDYDAATGVLKINADGTAKVQITDETQGAAIKYYVAEKGEELAEPTFEEYSEALDLAEYVGKTVVVYAKATKGGAETPVVSAEYTIEAFADAEDVFSELLSAPVSGSEVQGGDPVVLYYELTDEYKEVYTLHPNTKDFSTVTLKFGKNEKEVPLYLNKDGLFQFYVPTEAEFANSAFTVDVPDKFYYAVTDEPDVNKVYTIGGTVEFTTGLASDEFTAEYEKWLNSSATTVDIKIWYADDPTAEVDFVDPESNDPTHGASFTQNENEVVTDVVSVEKVEGTPNTFRVTFENEEGAEFIENYFKSPVLQKKGYIIGFPENTFVCGSYTNGKNNCSTHIFFEEDIEYKFKPTGWTRCEGAERVQLTVLAVGRVSDKSYNPAFDSKDPSVIRIDNEKVITITGEDIFGEPVDKKVTKIERVTDEEILKAEGTKDVFYLYYGHSALVEDGGDGTVEGNKPYLVTIPEGTFQIGDRGLNLAPAFEGKLDVMAHPEWAMTVRPFDYEKDSKGATSLTIDFTVTLDDPMKLFERKNKKNIKKDKEGKDILPIIKVGTEEVTDWDIVEGSFAEGTNEEGLPQETFTVVVNLKTPVKKEVEVVVQKSAFIANACSNYELSSMASPYVRYFIQDVEYTIATNTTSVTYEMWAEYPDGNRVNKKIDYIGATEDQTIYTAASYNDAKNTLAPSYPEIDPADNTSTGKFDNGEAETVTVFTVIFPEGTLIPNKYKLDFPDGTVQAEGCNANLNDELWNKFNVVSAIDFDATSSEEDYNEPAVYPKDKVYNISTSTKEITLYLTGENLWSHGNANSRVVLLEGTELLLDGEEGEVTWENATEGVDGIYTVTLPERSKNGGLEPGTYKLSIPDMKIYSRDALDMLKDADEGSMSVAKDVYNKELTPEDPLYSTLYPKFTLIINVEDFAGPTDAIKITTKTYAFDVKVGDEKTTMTVINDEEGNAPTVQLGGAQATLENSAKPGYVRVVLPTAEKEECKPCFDMPKDAPELVKGAIEDELEEEEEVTEPKLGYFFMHSCQEPEEEPAPYPLVIPAGSFKGQYATNYDDIKANVDVIFEFIDSGTGINDKLEDPNDLTTTFCEVLDEVYVQKEMLFTRAFRNQHMQALAVPFDIKQSEVADYFTIYRLDMVWEDSKGDFQLNYLSVGEDGIAYANKPYIIVPTAKAVAETEASERGAVSITFENKKVEYPMMSFINCATTKVHFQFFNTLFKQEFAEDMVEEYNWKTLSGDKIGNINGTVPAWRWWIAPVEKFGNYVKIALDGFVQDDADGIDFVEAAKGDTQIFNVAGQKLNTAAKGKVNIINGKKVFVK